MAKEKNIERRAFQVSEIRSDDQTGKLVGYAAVFNSPTDISANCREVIRPGAFTKTIKDGADVRALWNHNPDYVLGRTKSGTLNLTEDDRGLRVEITPPNNQWANDLKESITRGDVSQMSFGFYVVRDNKIQDPDFPNRLLRELLEVQLFDVSPVTYPAYEDTEIDVRSLDGITDINKASEFLNKFFEKMEMRSISKDELINKIEKRTQIAEESISEESIAPVQENHPKEELEILRRKLELKTKLFQGDFYLNEDQRTTTTKNEGCHRFAFNS